jgi:cell division protein FtsB
MTRTTHRKNITNQWGIIMPISDKEIQDFLEKSGKSQRYPVSSAEELLTNVFTNYIKDRFKSISELEGNSSGRSGDIQSLYKICHQAKNSATFKIEALEYIDNDMRTGFLGIRNSKLANGLKSAFDKSFDSIMAQEMNSLSSRNTLLGNQLNQAHDELNKTKNFLDKSISELRESTNEINGFTKIENQHNDKFTSLKDTFEKVNTTDHLNNEEIQKLRDSVRSLKKEVEDLKLNNTQLVNENNRLNSIVNDADDMDGIGSYNPSYQVNSSFEARVVECNLTKNNKNESYGFKNNGAF